MFTQADIDKALREGVRRYFINYKVPSGDPDDKQTHKKYIGEW